MPSPTFTNDYAANGKAIREAARAAAGHRCIRCGHPFKCGESGSGEWSPCDERCTHSIPVRLKAAPEDLAWIVVEKCAENLLIPIADYIRAGGLVEAKWRVLTVHHFDGNKANDRWWNLLALCQACHLSFQTRVNPEIPWMFEHSEWLRPYVAAFYAFKYRGLELTREEVMANLEELLSMERFA